jgi:Acyl-protein synthetase, LuxE
MIDGCGGKPAEQKTAMNAELINFAARLGRSISQQDDDSAFNEPALELFGLQFNYNPAYRRFCEIRRLTPNNVRRWTEVPFVPAAAFKELELSCIAPDERTAVFHSSGTTEQNPSRHFHCAESLALYETSLSKAFEENVVGTAVAAPLAKSAVPTTDYDLIVLSPHPRLMPQSSLVHMFETVRQKLAVPETVFVGELDTNGAWVIDFDAALAALRAIGRPKLILGTAFSFVHLLDFLGESQLRLQMPGGTRVMETGGYKNRSRMMPKTELHSLITEFLGIPREQIICEYGMSELSSQAYDTGNAGRHFHFPPWARTQIVSPETGREVGEGETGLIRIFDLANVFSVAAIQTEDLAVRRGDGFGLIGRATLAEPRGCSLMTA